MGVAAAHVHAQSARRRIACGVLFAVVLVASPTVAPAHEPASRSVMQGTCSYYAAYYLGADCGRADGDEPLGTFAAQGTDPAVFEGPVPRADCGPGSRAEPALQGEVPQADRDAGRSAKGYACNLELVGNYAGEGSTWSAAYYKHCAYYATNWSGTQANRGVVVVDVSDPAHPKFVRTLTSIAMLSPHESLKVNEKRGLLGAITAGELTQTGVFDVYDIAEDCAEPRLLGTIPNVLGHEGNWAPDGRTYYASGGASLLTAIDVTDPTSPSPLATLQSPGLIHGLGVSEDSKSLYLAHVNPDFLAEIFAPGWPHGLTDRNGMGVYDVSTVHARSPNPNISLRGAVNWKDGSVGQHALSFRSGGRPYVLFVDEFGWGGPRIIDVSDPAAPRIVSKLKLEIQMPQNRSRAEASTHGSAKDGTGPFAPFGYNSHYCNVDRERDPTILVCANVESGIRVFDIREIRRPREIAYFNPGGDGVRRPGSFAGATSSYVVTQPRVLPNGEIWFTDQDRGLYIVRFTNAAWPFAAGSSCRHTLRVSVAGVLGASRARRLRSATIYLNGRRVTTLRGRRLRRSITLGDLGGSTASVRVAGRRVDGRRVTRTRTYRLCAA